MILATELTAAQTARLAEAQSDLPGIDMEEQPVRNYPYGKQGSHLFGYVGVIDEDEYKARKRTATRPTTSSARTAWRTPTTAGCTAAPAGAGRGQRVGFLVRPQAARPDARQHAGDTIDWRLQRSSSRTCAPSLRVWGKARGQRRSGAVVVIDPQERRRAGDGLDAGVRPRTSSRRRSTRRSTPAAARQAQPALRPRHRRRVADRLDLQDGHRLRRDLERRRSNRTRCSTTLARGIAMASSFRDIAAGGLGRSTSCARLPRRPTATSTSSADRLGHERLQYFATQYGLGSKLGVDLPGEYPGNWPTEEWTQRRSARATISNRATSASSRSVRARCKRRRCRWPTSPRPSSTAARSTGRTSSSRSARRTARAQVVRSRGHPQGPGDAPRRCERCARGWHKVTMPAAPRTDSRSTGCRSAAKPARPKPRRARREHDLVRRVCAVRPSEDCDGGVRGAVGGYGATVAAPIAQHVIPRVLRQEDSADLKGNAGLYARTCSTRRISFARASVRPGVHFDQVVALRAVQAVGGGQRHRPSVSRSARSRSSTSARRDAASIAA